MPPTRCSGDFSFRETISRQPSAPEFVGLRERNSFLRREIQAPQTVASSVACPACIDPPKNPFCNAMARLFRRPPASRSRNEQRASSSEKSRRLDPSSRSPAPSSLFQPLERRVRRHAGRAGSEKSLAAVRNPSPLSSFD